ncbi:MAG: hypothetical protein U9R08_06500, partial [Nanoarchaeota archaeon]|nr:hypothetical protein [Nanoarchaeota archaeon]
MIENISYTEHSFKESIIHVLKVKKDSVKLKLVLVKDKLTNSVAKHDSIFGINAGFFNIDTLKPFLGFKNSEHESPFISGLPVINFSDDSISISEKPLNSFLQTGPLLLKDSIPNYDFTYFKGNEHLFDCYINASKNPRSAFAYDDNFYYFIAVDGRSKLSTGL